MPGVTVYNSRQADTAALAAAAFADSPTSLPETSYVCVGDTISTDEQEGFLRYTFDAASVVSTTKKRISACILYAFPGAMAHGFWTESSWPPSVV